MADQELDEYLAECRDAGCTERQLAAWELHVGGLDQDAIAVELGISQAAVSQRIAGARRHVAAQEDRHVLRRQLSHLIEQDIEEVVVRGSDEDEDTVSVWRRAALEHQSGSRHAIKPTRRKRKKPQGIGVQTGGRPTP
jgi:predicted transcriptional regulator